MEHLPQALYVLLAGAVGVFGGWLFFRCWRALLPAGRSRAFWSALPETVGRMVAAEEPSDVLRHYRELIGTTTRYAVRGVGAVLVALLPTSILFLLLTALDPSDRLTSRIDLQPASAIASRPALPHFGADDRIVVDRNVLASSTVRLGGVALTGAAQPGKHAWCDSITACALLEMMLFDTRDLGKRADDTRSVIARPAVFDGNPFWPYLNDLEFAFFVATVFGSALAALWRRARAPREAMGPV